LDAIYGKKQPISLLSPTKHPGQHNILASHGEPSDTHESHRTQSGVGDTRTSDNAETTDIYKETNKVATIEPSNQSQRVLRNDPPVTTGRDWATGIEDQKSKQLKLWIIPCFRISRFGVKAIHIDVTDGRYDADLFETFRELYFSERSRFRRFFDLKEVKHIRFINVNYKYCECLKELLAHRSTVRSYIDGSCEHSEDGCVAP
jgi:hypothetical protein